MTKKIGHDEFRAVIHGARYLQHDYNLYRENAIDLGLTPVDNAKIERLINDDIYHQLLTNSKKSFLGKKILLTDEEFIDYGELKKYVNIFRVIH